MQRARNDIQNEFALVIIRPLLAEWEVTKVEVGATVERASAAKSAAARTRLRQQAERSLRSFLERLRKFSVLDPACGSGNFLYMALHALKDIEHRVQLPRQWAFNAVSRPSGQRT